MPNNELTYDQGLPVSLIFALANPGAAATTAMTLAQANTGFVVPTGYAFHPLCLNVNSNADLTAGTLTGKVSDNGTVIAGGPEPALSDPTQRASAVKRVGAAPIAAARIDNL